MTKRTFTPIKTVTNQAPRKFKPWSEYSAGDILLGKYLGPTGNKFDESKPNYLLEVIEVFLKDKKVQKEYVEGTVVCLNHVGMLHKALVNLEIGKLIQITYQGAQKMEKGKFAGKSAHSMEVVEVVEDGDETSTSDDL